eukprot:TRINITY_DN901_c4_g1_i1.p1 TRINITY_DN901_c4_g1~~TRINITY_DN901_c4_g1_i1.p1  ORF type:complete len:133 (-),score=7.40 TRINITY_DN901_c4_g1_i1:737-1135(-)
MRNVRSTTHFEDVFVCSTTLNNRTHHSFFFFPLIAAAMVVHRISTWGCEKLIDSASRQLKEMKPFAASYQESGMQPSLSLSLFLSLYYKFLLILHYCLFRELIKRVRKGFFSFCYKPPVIREIETRRGKGWA